MHRRWRRLGAKARWGQGAFGTLDQRIHQLQCHVGKQVLPSAAPQPHLQRCSGNRLPCRWQKADLPELLEEKEVEVNSLSFFWTHGFSSTNIQPLLGHWALEMGWERRGQRSRGGSSRRWACRGWRLGLSDKNTQSSPGLSHPPSVTLGATTPGGRGRSAGG